MKPTHTKYLLLMLLSPTDKDHRYFTKNCKISIVYAIITDKKSISELPWKIFTIAIIFSSLLI